MNLKTTQTLDIRAVKKKKKKGEREKGKIRIKHFAIFIDDAAFQPPAPTVKIIVLILCNEKIQLDYH